jgi:hypothetical protein
VHVCYAIFNEYEPRRESTLSRKRNTSSPQVHKCVLTESSKPLPKRRYKICMASSTETEPLSSLSFIRNSTTLNSRRGSYPAKDTNVQCHAQAVLGSRFKIRTGFVVPTTVIHRLELRPVDALVAIIVNFPNHVLDLRLERRNVVVKANSQIEHRFSALQ